MVLSKRELIIAAVTAIIVGLIVGNELVFTPIATKLQSLGKERMDLKNELAKADNLIDRQKRLKPEWDKLQKELPDEATTQSKVSDALIQWSQKCGVQLNSVRPDNGRSEKGLAEKLFVYTGTGTMSAVASFMWEIESSELPLKITSLQLSSSDAGEKMQTTLTISAIYPSAAPSGTRATEAGAKSNEEETL